MNSVEIVPGIRVVRTDAERSVLVAGKAYVTAIGLPKDPLLLSELLETAARMAPRGLGKLILTSEADAAAPIPAPLQGVQIVRPGCEPVRDDAGRIFQIEACLGSPDDFAVTVEPEQVMVVCDDLHPTLPPRIEPGAVHETLMRLQDWRLRAPQVLIPASGTALVGEQVDQTLERGVGYLRGLYQRTRTGMVESRLPWERLVYTIPSTSVWDSAATDGALLERHRRNVRCMAEDIWRRMQAEADEVSLAA